MPGLENSFGMASGSEKSWVEKNFLGPEKFFQVQPSKTKPRARHSSMPGLESSFWHGFRSCKRRGEETHFSGPEKFFLRFWGPKQGSTGKTKQDKLTRAKASTLGQKPASESDWCQEPAANFRLANCVRIRFPPAPGICLLLACFACHRVPWYCTQSFFREIAATKKLHNIPFIWYSPPTLRHHISD